MDMPKAVKKKAKGGLAVDWYAEFAQRQLATMAEAARGWFFEGWKLDPADEGDEQAGTQSLQACLAKGWVDLATEAQTMQPADGKHQYSLVYLHGFQCDGYSYLLEPEHFYRAKPKKKAKGKKSKKDEEDEQEYEPIPGLKVILPTAPRRKITCHNGKEEHSWYDYLTDFDGDQEDEFAEEELEAQQRRIHGILDAEAAKVGGKNVFLGGASQGCGVALHCGLTYEGELGAIVGTMGQLLTRTEVTPEWVARKVPVFVYIGLADSMMPWDKWVGQTWARLEDAGADIRIEKEPGVDHGEAEDGWTRNFLQTVLRPSSVKAVAKKKTGGKK